MAGKYTELATRAKKVLKDFVPGMDKRIGEFFEREISRKFGFNDRQRRVVLESLEHSREYILRPTKRLRGSFVVYGHKLSGKSVNKKVWDAAVAAEIVHAALLMHDDFQDGDERRRGGITTHKYYEQKYKSGFHFGESMAVNVGDELLCLGFDLLASCGNTQATRKMLSGIAETAYGQAYDLSLEQLAQWTEQDVLVLHRAKTGIYTYENPLLIGAHLGGLGGGVISVLRNYSADGGVAFQLQDDILGVFGDPEKTGKSADSDLKQGKCTLLVLKTFQDGTAAQVEAVKKVWGVGSADKVSLKAAKQAIIDSGSYEYSRKLASKLAAKAAKTAEGLRRFDLNQEAIDYIQGVAEYMVEREV